METYNYLEAVKADIIDRLPELREDLANKLKEGATRDEIRDYLDGLFWVDDMVTGNGSGMYDGDFDKVAIWVITNIEMIGEVQKEWGSPLNHYDVFSLDVVFRCYVLAEALSDVLDDYLPNLCDEVGIDYESIED